MNREFGKAALFIGVGGFLGWKSLSPDTKKDIQRGLNHFLNSPAPSQPLQFEPKSPPAPLSLEPPQPQSNLRAPFVLTEGMRTALLNIGTKPSTVAEPPSIRAIADSKWASVIVHPCVVLVLGKRGSGKSALGYYLLELFSSRLSPYAVGIPEAAAKLLPDWIGVAGSLEDVPPRSIVLLDEAHLSYHSRTSSKKANRDVSSLLNLVRQKELTVIVVTQEARQIDVNIASAANVVVFKEPSMLQFEFERRELRQIAQTASDSFKTLPKNQRDRSCYVHAPDADFHGMLDNDLSTFWNARLSKAFASKTIEAQVRKPVRLTREQKLAKAIELGKLGWSLSQIATELGVSRSTVVNYLRDYPYKS